MSSCSWLYARNTGRGAAEDGAAKLEPRAPVAARRCLRLTIALRGKGCAGRSWLFAVGLGHDHDLEALEFLRRERRGIGRVAVGLDVRFAQAGNGVGAV